MSTTVTEIYDGLSLTYNGQTGGTMRKFVIGGLPIPITNPSDNFALAVQSIGLPQYGQAHPTITDLYCSGCSAQPFVDVPGSTSKGSLLLTYDYSMPSASQPLGGVYRELFSSNGTIVKNRWEAGDQAGQPILIGYKPKSDGSGPDPAATFPGQINPATAIANDPDTSGTYYDTASFQEESPNLILTVVRQETSSIPGMVYRKSVNSTAWLGFAAFTALCREVHASFVFGIGFIPNHWVVSYVFEIAPDPTYWKHAEIFRDWQTQKPALVNLLDGTNNGYTIVSKATQDFNGLNFPNNLLTN